jgi:hypothetical protein
MSHLTNLTKLDISDCQLPEQSVLPATLQHQELYAWDAADSLALVTKLQPKQLQHLGISVGCDESGACRLPLLQIAQLPGLQSLAQQYGSDTAACSERTTGWTNGCFAGRAAAANAAMWPLPAVLPQLQQLEIHADPVWVEWLTEHEQAAIIDGVVAATSLTNLKLSLQFPLHRNGDNDLLVARAASSCSLAGCQGESTLLQQLLQLGQLPALQHLDLLYGSRDYRNNDLLAAATAPAWLLLPAGPQLHMLRIGIGLRGEREWVAILAGLAAATSLTSLVLEIEFGAPLASDVVVCPSLTGHTHLKEFECSIGGTRAISGEGGVSYLVHQPVAADDALALTALTSLTRLGLSLGRGVGSSVARQLLAGPAT